MKSREEYKIVLSLPPKELSPNSRVFYMKKARATKEYRNMAKMVTLAATENSKPMWKKAQVSLLFLFKDTRKRDKDNFLASMKAAFDGIADAELIENDCGFHHNPVEFGVSKTYPRVEITLKKVE